jgi:succinate dehydrogenase / fumarate reductase membrane anchor subunit
MSLQTSKPHPPHIAIMRSSLGRARGLGAARSGVRTWWAERLTSIALVPLTLWFIISVLSLLGEPREEVVRWISQPIALVLMLSLVLATFYHLAMGLQVVIEDYIENERARLAALLAAKGATFLLGLSCLVAVLKLGL